MKSARELVVPVLFLIEGVFWLGLVATGGATILLLAAIVFILSGAAILAIPSRWFTRPFAGASALFGLVVTVWQVYQAATLLGSNFNGVGVTSGAVFAIFALVSVYLELQTLSLGSKPMAKVPKSP